MSDTANDERKKESTPRPVYVPRWLAVGGAWGWRFVALALSLYMIGAVARHLWVAVLPVMLGIVLATLLEPLARQLHAAHVPRGIAAALSVILGLSLLGGVTALFIVTTAGELSELGQSLVKGYRDIVEWVAQLAGVSRDAVTSWVDRHLQQLQTYAGSIAQQVITRVVGVFQVLTILLVMLVFTWFFTWDGDRQFEGLLRVLPEYQRPHGRALGRRVWHTVGSYMRGMFVIASADALLLGLALWVIGLPLVLPLMLLMFVGSLVPFVGPIVAGTMAALVGLAHGGLGTAALVALAALIVQLIEGNLLQPFVMGRAVQLHPAVILFAITAGGVLAGVAGVFLAVPVAASLFTVLAYAREQGAA